MTSLIKRPLPVIREITFSYTINANSTYNTNLKTLIDNHIPTGYICGGVVGFATNNTQVIATNCGYYESEYSLQLANRSGSAISSTVCRIFYLAFRS